MARYLVVDDDAAAVHGLTQLLELDGHEVAPFTRAGDAVDALASEQFDAVVTDLEMPEVDGHAVVRAVCEHQEEACLVVATARAEEHEEALLAAGACAVSDKPMDYDEMVRAIAHCRAHGGPGGTGRCHLRARQRDERAVRLRRK